VSPGQVLLRCHGVVVIGLLVLESFDGIKRETCLSGPMAKTRIIIHGAVLLALAAVALGCSGSATQTSTPTSPPLAAYDDDVQPDLVALRRDAIETAYPEFKDFEDQESFAGRSVKSEVDDGDYYFAYIVHGSGLPIAQATCFRVDRVGRVFQVGVFPDPVDSYAGYADIDPRNCRGTR